MTEHRKALPLVLTPARLALLAKMRRDAKPIRINPRLRP